MMTTDEYEVLVRATFEVSVPLNVVLHHLAIMLLQNIGHPSASDVAKPTWIPQCKNAKV
jgi:hypothetical protein